MNKPHPINNVFPLIGTLGFFVAWYFSDIYIATITLMAVLSLQLLLMLIFKLQIKKITWVTFFLVVSLGSLTVFFRDKTFIQMKTTVIYSIMAFILLASDYILKHNLIKKFLISFIEAPDSSYRRLSNFLAFYFFLLAIINWFVATYFPENIWVVVKTFGFPIASTIVICILLFPIFRRYAKDGE